MNEEEEEDPLNLEPGLPAKELDRRLKMLVQQSNEADEKIAFYRSLLSKEEEKAYAAEHGSATNPGLHEIEFCFEGEDAVRWRRAKAEFEKRMGRVVTDTEFVEHVIESYVE